MWSSVYVALYFQGPSRDLYWRGPTETERRGLSVKHTLVKREVVGEFSPWSTCPGSFEMVVSSGIGSIHRQLTLILSAARV